MKKNIYNKKRPTYKGESPEHASKARKAYLKHHEFLSKEHEEWQATALNNSTKLDPFSQILEVRKRPNLLSTGIQFAHLDQDHIQQDIEESPLV